MHPDRLDTRPLSDPIDRAELRAFRRSLPKGVLPGRSLVVVLWVAAALSVLPGLVLWTLVAETGAEVQLSGMELLFGLFVLVIPTVCIAVIAHTVRQRSGRRQFRIAGFARANGLDYRALTPSPQWPGMIFALAGMVTTDVVSRADGLAIGNHLFTSGGGRNQRTHRWSFATMRLPRPLPHIVLDARGNNSLAKGGLPIDLDRRQRLGLEGDFDRHFTLYCPAGYEADALYLFTPDVMARFIDHAAELDVEIVDDRLFLYSRNPLSSTDPETWRWIASVIDALEEKIARWERWRDERLEPASGTASALIRPPRSVAPQGRRLARRSGWLWGVAAIGFGLFGWWSIITDALEALGLL